MDEVVDPSELTAGQDCGSDQPEVHAERTGHHRGRVPVGAVERVLKFRDRAGKRLPGQEREQRADVVVQ